METDQGLLQEILDRPDDDDPRLVYADWLEEQNCTYAAELIRVQCQLARIPKVASDDEELLREELLDRQLLILNKMQRRWCRTLRELHVKRYQYRRGFIEFVAINANRNLSDIEELFASYPTIRFAKLNELNSDENHCEEVSKIKEFNQLIGLDLSRNSLTSWALRSFGDGGAFRNVESLVMPSNPIHSNGLMKILSGNVFPNLKRLNIASCNLGIAEEARKGLQTECFRQLESLNISQVINQDHEILNTLFADIEAPNLKRLTVGQQRDWRDQGWNEHDISPFLDSPMFRTVEELDLKGTWTSANLRRLFHHPHSSNIRRLDVHLNTQNFRYLMDADSIWQSLKQLNVFEGPQSMFVFDSIFAKRVAKLDWFAMSIHKHPGSIRFLKEIETEFGVKVVPSNVVQSSGAWPF